jgi:murein L,D-transpeptidase YcbB/YkuD
MSIKRATSHSVLLALGLIFSMSVGALPICKESLTYMLDTGLHPYLTEDFSAQRGLVRQFYEVNQQQLAWFRDNQLTPQGHSLLGKISGSSMNGLQESISAGKQGKKASRCQLSLYDTALTIGGLHHLQSLKAGQQQPVNQLLALSQHTRAEQQLSDLEPDFPIYSDLQQALEVYRQLANDPALSTPQPVPAKSLHPGTPYPAIDQIVYKLQRLGDLQIDPAYMLNNGSYADELVPAVKRFQARHGLKADGVLGKQTFLALNTPIEERVQQIELSLLRWRELPLDPGERMLVVNIPHYKLFAFERTQDAYTQAMEMKVIVGKSKRKHQTPVMSGEMTYIVFAPYWNIPYKILRDELYPKIVSDPDYLTSNDYQVVQEFSANTQVLPASEENIQKLLSGELKLRQLNGRKNALGSAKFMFPNQHAVYLHGTPAMSLFNRSKRDFSHGCVRLADPAGLAEYVLGQERDWSQERIDELIQSGKRKVVSLSTPLPVYLMYATATADSGGKVYFAQDIYHLDQKLEQELARTNPARRVPGLYPGG